MFNDLQHQVFKDISRHLGLSKIQQDDFKGSIERGYVVKEKKHTYQVYNALWTWCEVFEHPPFIAVLVRNKNYSAIEIDLMANNTTLPEQARIELDPIAKSFLFTGRKYFIMGSTYTYLKSVRAEAVDHAARQLSSLIETRMVPKEIRGYMPISEKLRTKCGFSVDRKGFRKEQSA